MPGSWDPQTLQMCGDSTRESSALVCEGKEMHKMFSEGQTTNDHEMVKKQQKNVCSILGHHWVCVIWMWLTCQPVSCACVKVGFGGHVETNSMPCLPSHLSLTHWCLPVASGLRLWLWLSVGETLLPSSAVCYRQGHTVWLQTHLTLQPRSRFLSALHLEPRLSNSGQGVKSVL